MCPLHYYMKQGMHKSDVPSFSFWQLNIENSGVLQFLENRTTPIHTVIYAKPRRLFHQQKKPKILIDSMACLLLLQTYPGFAQKGYTNQKPILRIQVFFIFQKIELFRSTQLFRYRQEDCFTKKKKPKNLIDSMAGLLLYYRHIQALYREDMPTKSQF